MKKNIFLLMLFAFALVSCRELSRNNPYDPASSGYKGVHYLNEAWYPEDTAISDMVFANGHIYIAGAKTGTGDCVIKVVDPAGTTPVAVTPLGAFSNISGICADDSGNLYITDDKPAVQVMDQYGAFTNFPLPNMAAAGSLQIEWLAGSVFISNPADKKIYKYTAGVPATPDSALLTCTANGYFTPGKIFRIGPYIYVVNKDKKNEIARFGQDLSSAGVFLFERGISDCAEAGPAAQALSVQAVFKVDSGLAVALKWGDYGEGPGKIINGRLITYDPAGKLIYILDGATIKIFGE